MRCLRSILLLSLALLGQAAAVHATDPLNTWTVQNSGVSNYLQNVVQGNGLLVAVGYEGAITTSRDGVEWTPRNSGLIDSLYTVTYGGGMFVAAGNRGALTVSEDGENWTPLNSGTQNPLFGSTYGAGQWVVAGGSNILVSANGFQWNNRPSPILPRAYLNAMAYGNGRFVGVGAGGYAVWSTNTFDWQRSDSKVGNHFALVHAGGQFVAGGGGFTQFAEAAVSTDGSLWTSRQLPTFVSLIDMVYGNGHYVALGVFLSFPPPAGLEFLFESFDGLEWTVRDLPTPAAIVGLTYADSRFYGVGGGGLILHSDSHAPARLQINGPPGTNGLELRIRGEVGRQYRLQASPDVAGPNWQDVLIFTNPTDPETIVTDPRANRFTRRFYRAVSP